MLKKQLLVICMFLISGSLMAQEPMHKRKQVTYEQVTKMMVKDLQLDEKQQKKVTKLNKKYKTLIEGEQREAPGKGRPNMGERPSGPPSGGMPGGPGGFGGGPGGGFGGGMPGGMGGGPRMGGMPGGPASEKSYDYDKKQKKYDKAISKILSEKQMEGYQEIKTQFASQRRVRDFLFGSPQDFNKDGKDK